MSDYTKTTNFTAKDALTTGNPLKVIKGSYFDTEFDNIATAVATKYDSGELASQAQAEAETVNTVLMTPLRVANWADANGGMVGDIQALADPNADKLLGWDDSGGAAIGFTTTDGIEFNATTIRLASTTGGAGLTFSSGVLAVGGGNGITANANDVALTDADASTTNPIDISSGTVSIDLTPVTNLTFGGDAAGAGADEFLVYDASATANKSLRWQDFGIPQTDNTTTTPFSSLALTDANRWFNCNNGSAITATIPANSSLAFPVGTVFALHQRGAGQITVAVTSDTLRSPNGAKTAAQYSTIFVIKIGSTEWTITGDSAS
jgi:hypothetical protein